MEQHSARILLVEDSPDQVELIKLELDLLGYTVLVATNGFEAVEMAGKHSPDLIIMDIFLPKMDGFQAAAEIKRNSTTKTIPILAATATATEGDRRTCLAAGCDDYIAKPFTQPELAKAIGKLLSKG